MKKFLCFALVFTFVMLFSLNAIASPIVSPALNVIAKNNKMIKSGLVSGDIYFSEQDFKKTLGVSYVDSVKVEKLPSAAEGVLKLGTLVVTEGQTVKSEYLSVLRFVPADENVTGASIVFSHNGTDVPCTLKFLDSVNYAPVFASDGDDVTTYTNVSYYGNVRMSDPEGDKLDLQVVSYPKHGLLTVTDSLRGSYKYTPVYNFVGEDEFMVVARDNCGNYSTVSTVNIRVEKNDVFFTDAKGHWCENAAICLYEKGIAEAVKLGEGLVFSPNDNVSREEFVVMVMKALGANTLTDSDTSFADNSAIDVRYRPYIATAERLEYVNGMEKDGLMYFDPKGAVSKAEAAVIVNNILGYESGDYISVFADDSAIPTWAKTAIYALTSAGVFNGNGDGVIAPSAILDRASAAQMIYNLID